MTKERILEISIAVERLQRYQEEVEKAKEEFRNMSQEEIDEINKGNLLHIERNAYTKTTYSPIYKSEVAKLQALYPPTKTTIANHTIKLTSTGYTSSKVDIMESFDKMNKTQLKKVASATRKAEKGV